MRKYHKNMLLETISTLKEAVSNLKELYNHKEFQAVTNLLADVQDGALQVGDLIDGLEGEGNPAVSYIEKYCETLYRASLELSKENADLDIIKELRKGLVQIESVIKTEIKIDKIEVAFIVYKASMWDSLESVWKSANDDPACEAFVVPIPFYDVNPDGSQGRETYEGGELPDYVPVVDWKNYDVEERKPDIIFTHYPYDGSARNSKIHSDFYSERLRKHCDLLAHVPYFGVQNNADYYETYTRLPGVLFAGKVFVPSDEIREFAVERYNLHDKRYGWNGKFGRAEDKFIALGSPKIDKVVNSKPEDFTLPEEWKKLIYKVDGSKKNVVLYNTHMWTWLNNTEKYFKKLADVFETFSKREDAVIWWRPHPSTELNFRIFQPELLNAYKNCVETYKRSGIGIYDDASDLHAAINFSDGYYGDLSSLATLYEATGKPLMLQDINVVEEKTQFDCRMFDMNADEIQDLTQCCFSETNSRTLDNFIDFIALGDNRKNKEELITKRFEKLSFAGKTDGKSGERIYDYTKSLIY